MSRHSPTGFGFGILLEIAAVIAVVAFLPRIDLRPSVASAAFNQDASEARVQIPSDAPVSPVGWTALDLRNGEATRATSYYERVANPSTSSPPTGSFSATTGSFSAPPAPPLIETPRPDPKYVEDRLDRASQRLVNSVGSAVTTATNSLLPPQKPQSPVPNRVQRPQTSQTTAQPRPWLRY